MFAKLFKTELLPLSLKIYFPPAYDNSVHLVNLAKNLEIILDMFNPSPSLLVLSPKHISNLLTSLLSSSRLLG